MTTYLVGDAGARGHRAMGKRAATSSDRDTGTAGVVTSALHTTLGHGVQVQGREHVRGSRGKCGEGDEEQQVAGGAVTAVRHGDVLGVADHLLQNAKKKAVKNRT